MEAERKELLQWHPAFITLLVHHLHDIHQAEEFIIFVPVPGTS